MDNNLITCINIGDVWLQRLDNRLASIFFLANLRTNADHNNHENDEAHNRTDCNPNNRSS